VWDDCTYLINVDLCGGLNTKDPLQPVVGHVDADPQVHHQAVLCNNDVTVTSPNLVQCQWL